MRRPLTTLRRNRWLASLLVVAFALRAVIPVGFMPGGSGTFSLQVCPDGFPAILLASTSDHAGHAGHHPHHHEDHDHKSWMSGHCVFGAVVCAPPLWHSSSLASIPQQHAPRPDAASAPHFASLRYRIAQPRAPPRLA